MKTRESTDPRSSGTHAQSPMQHAPRHGAAQAANPTGPRTAPGRPEAGGDPGALEYASWLRLLHRPTH